VNVSYKVREGCTKIASEQRAWRRPNCPANGTVALTRDISDTTNERTVTERFNYDRIHTRYLVRGSTQSSENIKKQKMSNAVNDSKQYADNMYYSVVMWCKQLTNFSLQITQVKVKVNFTAEQATKARGGVEV
jgi:hypothetical protein